MKSLQSRLHWGLAGSLMILMLFMGWLIHTGMAQVSREMMVSRLEHDAQALLASLQPPVQGQLILKDARLGSIYNQAFSGHYYMLVLDGEELRSRSLWDWTLEVPETGDADVVVTEVPGPDGQVLLQWTKRFERFGLPVTIVVAEDITSLQAALRRFNLYFALGVAAVLVVVLLIQTVIVRRSLASLRGIRREVQALADGEISMLSGQVPTEIVPLVEEVNHLLQLLAQRLQRSRNAVGNLAHGLKHPLGLLMQLLDNEVVKQHPQLVEEIDSNTRKILQIMERELKRARLSGGGVPGQRFIASAEVPGLVDVLQRVHHDRNLQISYEIPQDLEYPADRNDMLELLGNLLDNACKWSAGKVRVKMSLEDGLRIQVEDNGAGCDKEQMSRLLGRGVRVDENTSGSGLGLAIVKEIVELYQGEILFSRSPLGGLAVTVKLPWPEQGKPG
ncbi:sensor histidine kinase [Thiolapillus sp.]